MHRSQLSLSTPRSKLICAACSIVQLLAHGIFSFSFFFIHPFAHAYSLSGHRLSGSDGPCEVEGRTELYSTQTVGASTWVAWLSFPFLYVRPPPIDSVLPGLIHPIIYTLCLYAAVSSLACHCREL